MFSFIVNMAYNIITRRANDFFFSYKEIENM